MVGSCKNGSSTAGSLGWMLADKTGGIRTSAMKDMVLRNSQRVDPKVPLTLEDRRMVNGREVLYIEYLLTQNSVPIRFAGYNMVVLLLPATSHSKSCNGV